MDELDSDLRADKDSCVDDDLCVDDALVEEPDPALSASAMAGLLVIAVPIPSAMARAPTRPTYRDAGVVANLRDDRPRGFGDSAG